jgi:hypothetical protein
MQLPEKYKENFELVACMRKCARELLELLVKI